MTLTELQIARANLEALQKVSESLYDNYPLSLLDGEEGLSNRYYKIEEDFNNLLSEIHNKLHEKEKSFLKY